VEALLEYRPAGAIRVEREPLFVKLSLYLEGKVQNETNQEKDGDGWQTE
jgi:hypothetical protein